MGILFQTRAAPQTNNKQDVIKVIDLLSNSYSPFGMHSKLTNIPEVRTAVNFIAELCSTVPFSHVRITPKPYGQRKIDTVETGGFHRVLTVRANSFQVPQVFFSNIFSRLLYFNNIFILPEWDSGSGDLRSLTPLPFRQFQFEKIGGVTWVIFSESGTAFLYSDIIHLQRFPDINQGARQQTISTTTDVVSAIQTASKKQLEASGKIKALLIPKNSALKSKEQKVQLEEFKQNFLTSENVTGLGMLSGNYDVKEINFNMQEMDTETMKELLSGIYNYFGTSANIINCTAGELEYQQFVNRCESVLMQIAQEFTYKLFSDKEIEKGNRIGYDELTLEIAALSQKSLFLDKAVYQGTMTRNEARRRLGLSWILGGDELLANKNTASMSAVAQMGGDKNV